MNLTVGGWLVGMPADDARVGVPELDKLYLESLDFNVAQFERATQRLLTHEGRLVAHEYDSSYVDLRVLALWRETFEQSLVRAAVSRQDGRQQVTNGNR